MESAIESEAVTDQRAIKDRKGDGRMNEKIYHSMTLTGACDIAVGIIVLAVGITTGILTLVNGARILKNRKNIII